MRLVLARGVVLMSIVPLNLPASSNPSRFGYEGDARLINCYSEALGSDAKSSQAIYAIEGLDTFLTVSGSGGVKCLMPTESYLYGVAGTDVFAIDVNNAITIVATLTIVTDSFMASNRRNPTTQVGLVSNDQYRSITGLVSTLVTTNLIAPPSTIDVRDGYFLMTQNFGRYQKTAEDDATTLSLTDFGKAQRSADEIVRVMATETDIILFGKNSIEWHSNQPNALGAFPFVPVSQKNIGIIGRAAAARLDDTILFVASDGTVRQVQGYDGVLVSTPAVQRAVGSVTDKSTIVGTAWNSLSTGHKFFAFSCASWTWVYDLTTGQWHERMSSGMNRWRIAHVCEWNGVTIAGDASSGELYVLSGNYMDEAGEPITMTVQTAPTEAGPYPLDVNALYVDTVPGVGTVGGTAANTNPELLIDWSDDGGWDWSDQRRELLGAAGETNTQVKATRLGQIRRNGRTWRFQCGANVARCITGAYLDVEKAKA